MKDENCIFCLLAGGDIPTATLYEDDQFRVILDAGPATKGHALILPKQHYANIFEIDEAVLRDLIVLGKKTAQAMKDALGCDGVNLVQNNGPCAGQTVFHFHYHLIPRYENDGQNILWEPHSPNEEDQKKLCSLLSLK